METVLAMLKVDLSISSDVKDLYFTNMINACNNELNASGVVLDFTNMEDIMLLSDYAAYKYRKRTENVPLAENLRLRIMNRKIKGRAENG